MNFVTAACWLALATTLGCRPAIPRLGGSFEFRDSNWGKEQLSGHVVYRPATNERLVALRLYWGRSKSERLTETPIVTWPHIPASAYYHFVDSPRPEGATHWLLFAVDESGAELGPALAVDILDDVRPTLPFRELPVRCDQVAEERELQVFRSAEELTQEGVACSAELGKHIDFSKQSLVHIQLHAACPADWGIRVLGVKRDEARNLLEVYVHVWSSNEYEAACQRSFWLAVDALPSNIEAQLVRFSTCEHPLRCKM